MQRKQFLRLMGATLGGVVLTACGGGDEELASTLDAPAASTTVLSAEDLSAEEIAGLIIYLCSEEAAFVTGANIAINGGQHMQ